MHSFIRLFTADKPVVFALHGCQHLVHQMLHHRSHPGRFHVRGLNEQGTTTTPFAMVILNAMSRFHLAAEAIHRSPLKSAREESMKRLETMIADAVRSKPEKLEPPLSGFPLLRRLRFCWRSPMPVRFPCFHTVGSTTLPSSDGRLRCPGDPGALIVSSNLTICATASNFHHTILRRRPGRELRSPYSVL